MLYNSIAFFISFNLCGINTMTIDRARELLNLQINMGSGSGYNRNSAMLILSEVQKLHGQGAVDQLIRELDLETIFAIKPGEKIII